MARKRKNSVTDDQIEAAYRQTQSGQKVCRLLGVGSATVCRVLKKRGVPMNGLNLHREMVRNGLRTYRPPYDGSKQDIVDMYKGGMSYRAIAEKIGRSINVVGRIVKKEKLARPFRGKGTGHSNWSGGRVPASHGYWRVWVEPTDVMASMRNHHGYVLEHRLVLARKLGRPLLSTETVHHINGDRTDNHPDNLELRQGKHGKHVVMCCLDCGSLNVVPKSLR